MRYTFTLLILIICLEFGFSQPVYQSSYYASAGDTTYFTAATVDTSVDFFATGPAHTWNFSKIVGTSQQRLVFRNPENTGYTSAQWSYLYNANNVNISYTNGQSTDLLGQATVSDRNDYYLKNTGGLLEKASGYTVTATGGITLNIKNTYTTADSVYKFPLHYTDTFSSNAGFTTTSSFIYYNQETLARTNKVDGWGTVITPYDTFRNCLRVVSYVDQVDTFNVIGYKIPKVTQQYRELKWLDTSKSYPVLYITQGLVGGNYVTSAIQFYDNKKLFPPVALFTYSPGKVTALDTVKFYNLSTTANSYLWNFGDSTATTTTADPQHTYTSPGTYYVTLIAYGDSTNDTLKEKIVVGFPLPIKLISFTGFHSVDGNLLEWSTAPSTKVASFEVERSADATYFNTIKTISGNGTSSNQNYQYLDQNGQQLGSIYYYRLKMTDLAGKINYSPTVEIGSSLSQNNVIVYPNPVSKNQNIKISLQSKENGSVKVQLLGIDGKVIKSMGVPVIAGTNIINLPSSNLAKGTYIINCLSVQGTIIGTSEVVIGN